MKARTHNELLDSIENLYRTFKRYRPSEGFHSCSHCVSETADAELKEKSLSELTCNDIGRYAFKAMTTWGTVEDFKHFLPRILDLIVTNDDFPIDIEVAIGKLAYGEWRSWPAKERIAIEQFLEAWWKNVLSRPLSDSTLSLADEVLCSLAQVNEDIESYLAHWDSRSDIESSLHLAAFVDWNFNSIYAEDRIDGAFWEKEITMRQAVEWLRRPATRERLESHFLDHSDDPHAYFLSEAAEKLNWWTSKNR